MKNPLIFLLFCIAMQAAQATTPILVEVFPTHLATNVPANTPLRLTFDQPIKKGTGNILIKDFTTNTLVFSVPVSCVCLSVSANTAILSLPANLSNNQTIFIELQPNTFLSLSNDGFAGITGSAVWRFATANGLVMHQAFVPVVAGTCVALSGSLQIILSTNVVAGSGSIYIYEKTNDILAEQLAATSSQVVIANNIVTIFIQTILKPRTQYYILINSNAFVTSAGAVYEGITNNAVWSFTTTESTPIAPDIQLCGSGQITLMASSTSVGVAFKWYNSPLGGNLLQTQDVFVTPFIGSTVTYYVAATFAGCESERKAVKAVVLSIPLANFSTQVNIQQGESTILQANGGVSYQWTPQTGLSDTTTANPVASPTQTTEYIVTITNAEGCTAQIKVTVLVRENENDVFLPNTFSPDESNSNDTFRVRGKNFANLTLTIYNKLGTLVYTANNVVEATQNGWNGTLSGVLQPSDTYIWHITGTYSDGTPVQAGKKNSGTVFLLR